MNKTVVFISLLLLFSDKFVSGKNISHTLSDEARLSVLTVGAGDPLFTLFGHTAIRLQDPKDNIDKVYNYGTFDFDSPFFYLDFIYGDLRYFLSVSGFEAFKQVNAKLGRSIKSQTLNLSPPILNSIVQKLEKGLMPENRYYRYEFLSNNCVTKARDVLEGQGALSLPKTIDRAAPKSTYRQLLNSYLEERPWIGLGVNLLLGAGTDRSINNRQQSFLPKTFYQSLAAFRLPGSGKPLVRSAKTILTPDQNAEDQLKVTPTAVFWLLFFIVGFQTIGSAIYGWDSYWLDRILFGLVGIAGAVITLTTLVSIHEPLQNNWNIIWAWPTHLIVAAGARKLMRNTWFRYYLWIALIFHLLAVLGWFLIPQQLPMAVIPILGMLIIRLPRLLINDMNKNVKAELAAQIFNHQF